MKIVGTRERTEIEPDPGRAWQRSKALDALLKSTTPAHPHGAWRLTHAQMNRLDTERQVAQAARINRP